MGRLSAKAGEDRTMIEFKYSYFQLTFGQEAAYLYPQRTDARLERYGHDAIEIAPPQGRYGLGVAMKDYLETHRRLKMENKHLPR